MATTPRAGLGWSHEPGTPSWCGMPALWAVASSTMPPCQLLALHSQAAGFVGQRGTNWRIPFIKQVEVGARTASGFHLGYFQALLERKFTCMCCELYLFSLPSHPQVLNTRDGLTLTPSVTVVAGSVCRFPFHTPTWDRFYFWSVVWHCLGCCLLLIFNFSVVT